MVYRSIYLRCSSRVCRVRGVGESAPLRAWCFYCTTVFTANVQGKILDIKVDEHWTAPRGQVQTAVSNTVIPVEISNQRKSKRGDSG